MSLTATLVFEEISFVEVSVCPVIHPIAVFLIEHVMSLVAFAAIGNIVPHSISVSKALFEISAVNAAVLPSVFSKPLGEAIHKLSLKLIAVEVILYSLSVFQSVFEVPQIEVAIGLLMLSFPVGQATPPGAFILFHFDVGIFGGGVVAKTEPKEGAPTVFFVLVVLTDIQIAVCVYLASEPTFLVIDITSLIDSSLAIYCYTDSVFFLGSDLPDEDFTLCANQFAVGVHEFLYVDDLRKRLIFIEKLYELLLFHFPCLFHVFMQVLRFDAKQLCV